jgi:hypothetical protein
MKTMFFWNAWPNPQKHIFQAFLVLFAASIIYYLTGYFWSSRLVIQWETISKITTEPFLLDTWYYAFIPMEISVDQYLITQLFEGSDLSLTTWPATLLLTAMAAGLVLTLSLAVDLPRFWFLVSQVVFIFTMVGFKLEQLLLFNRTDKAALILAFLLYLPASYYFHAVRKDTVLYYRMLVYGILTLIFALTVNFYSGVAHPFLYMVDYGIPIPMALTVIFILFTSHEIIYGFLVLITRSNTPSSSNSFIHFFALSLIYLGNVLFIYLRNTRRIEWDFYYIDAFWIMIGAGILGIWGLRQRGPLFKNIMPVEPHGLLGYLALAVISFATIGYFFSTANDPAVEALEDVIVFGHLSIGFVFLIYILFNFRGPLIANLKVYKVVFKPNKMPFFSMRLGGLIGALGLFLLSNQYPLDQAITAYYNGIGDLHRLDNQRMLAKEYYKLAAIYAQSNHRSNYAIASMAKEEKDLSDALAYFKQSTIKQPTPFAFVNTARAYEEQGMFFKAMFALKDGLVKFPNDPYISNNLATLYAKTDLLDSAYYYLENMHGGPLIEKVRQTNQLSLLALSGLDMSIDSVVSNSKREYPEVGSNLFLMANEQGQQIIQMFTPSIDTVLNPLTFAWWYNYNLNGRYMPDSVQLAGLMQQVDNPENQLYSDNLEFSRILRLYYSGDIASAFLLLRSLQFRNTSNSGFYNDLLGQWSLQQNQPRLAKDYFERSISAGYLPALWHGSVALVSLGEYEAAASNWGTFVYRSEGHVPDKMSELMTFVTTGSEIWDSLSDQQKCWHLQFKSHHLSQTSKRKMLDDIQDPVLYNQLERWFWEEHVNSVAPSVSVFQSDWKQQHAPLGELQAAIIRRDYSKLETLSSAFEPQLPHERHWIHYAKALLSEFEENHEQATIHYHRLLQNPFFEPGILAASRYLGRLATDEYQSYQVLLDALAVNVYSVPLLKAYGEQCAMLNLDTYLQTTMESLQQLIPATEYQSYLAELQVLQDSVAQQFDLLEEPND